jgi:YHS domain-containing protein
MIDPVCLMKVISGRKLITSIHNNKNYYFCADACREVFDENPEKYITLMTPKRKGLWGKYLERLNKVTGGKPPKCCH